MERNNMFKYATKELSKNAFICWCINWINYPDDKLYNLGKDMLNAILFPDIKNKKLYPSYEKREIIEKYNLINGEIKEDIKEEIKATREEIKNIEKLYNQKNADISKIIKDIEESKKELQKRINIDKITNLKIVRQFKKMDIVITINNEFVVIIEDKINGTTNQQLERYTNTMRNILENEDEEVLSLLELDKNKFLDSNIIPVYMKTGNITFNEKSIAFRRINGNVILNVLEKYKNENDIIQDFYECLKDKLNKENNYKYQEIEEQNYLTIGEKFEKRYVIYNCFKKYIKNTYASNKRLTQKGYFKFSNSIVGLWTPRLFNFNGWKNTMIEDGEKIVEERLKHIEDKKMTEPDIRYVFIRKRDVFNFKYFEFAGLYSIDTKKSTENKRIWKRLNTGEKVTLNIDDINWSNYRNCNGIETSNMLRAYRENSEIIRDFKANNTIKQVEEISNMQKIKIGTKFEKNYYCYNCFKKITGKEYTKESHPQIGGIALKEINKKLNKKNFVHVNIINLFNTEEEWQNEFKANYNLWVENISENFAKRGKLHTDIKYVFVFGKSKDAFGRNQYIFMGIYKSIKYDEKNNIRVWERQNKNEEIVPIDEDSIIKIIEKGEKK